MPHNSNHPPSDDGAASPFSAILKKALQVGGFLPSRAEKSAEQNKGKKTKKPKSSPKKSTKGKDAGKYRSGVRRFGRAQ